MPVMVLCPGCQTRYNLPDELLNKPVRCQQCMQAFTPSIGPAPTQAPQAPPAAPPPPPAPAPTQAAPPAPPAPPAAPPANGPAQPPPAPTKVRKSAIAKERTAPGRPGAATRPASKPVIEQLEELPAEEEAPAPAPVRKKQGSSVGKIFLILFLLGGGFFLLTGVAVAAVVGVLYYMPASTSGTPSTSSTPVTSSGGPLPPPVSTKPGDVGTPVVRDDGPIDPLAPPLAPNAPKSVVLNLTGAVDSSCAAGGGRFLLLKFQGKQLAVFDFNTNGIVRQIDLPNEQCLVAGGKDKFVVVDPAKKTLDRYSLKSLNKEGTAQLPINHTVTGVAMGHNTNGPLFVQSADVLGAADYLFFDVAEMKKVEVRQRGGPKMVAGPQAHVRAAADGTVFATSNPGAQANPFQVYVLLGNDFVIYSGGKGVPVPANDGKQVYGNGAAYDPTLAQSNPRGGACLPMLEGTGHLDVNSLTQTLTFYLPGGSPVQKSFTEVGLTPALLPANPPTMTVDRHVYYQPQAKLMVVVVPGENRSLRLTWLDLDAKPPVEPDKFIIRSEPPKMAKRGTLFRYLPECQNPAPGKVSVRLEEGPPGMRASAVTGTVTWAIPADYPHRTFEAVVVARDTAGRESRQRFVVALDNDGGPVVVDPPINPPPAADKNAVSLPAAFTEYCVGGGGRYLIFHLASERKLAVFDLAEGKVVKYVALAEDVVKFAAGQDHLFVALPNAGVLHRYNLKDKEFARDANGTLPLKGELWHLVMGAGSQGPLVVSFKNPDGDSGGGRAKAVMIDPATLKPLETDCGPLHEAFDRWHFVRPSADGQVFVSSAIGGQPTLLATFQGNKWKVDTLENAPRNWALPTSDGRFIFAAGGLFNGQGRALTRRDPLERNAPMAVPALDGSTFYLSATASDGVARLSRLTLNVNGDSRPLAALDFVEVPANVEVNLENKTVGAERRLLLSLAHKCLVVLPTSNDKLQVYKIDVEDILAKSTKDYLFVASQPPGQFKPGAEFSYKPVVRSKKGEPKIKLESGPDGMKVDGDKVTWTPPASFNEAEVSVLLLVTDASGQEIFHSFKLYSDKPGAGTKVEPGTVVLEKPTVIGLPAAATDVCAAAGGRLLIFNLPQQKQVAVFDAAEGKVVKYLAVPEEGVKIAANHDKLVVYAPTTGVLIRYSLKDFSKEATVRSPTVGPINALAMGSGSRGPVLALFTATTGTKTVSGLAFLDPLTFKAAPLTPAPGTDLAKVKLEATTKLYVSADGQLVSLVSGGGAQWQTLTLEGKVLKHFTNEAIRGDGNLLPAPDGRTLFCREQMYTADLKPVPEKFDVKSQALLPATQGRYFLGVRFVTNRPGQPGPASRVDLLVYMQGLNKPAVTLTKAEGLDTFVDGPLLHLQDLDRRIFLVPEEKSLVVVPASADKISVYKVDVEDAVEKSGQDYLFVTSRPPLQVAKGGTFSYTPTVKSKKGGVKVAVDFGPPGMKADETGKVTWTAPEAPKPTERDVSVILNVTDASGKQTFHTFRLSVVDKVEEPEKKPDDKKPDDKKPDEKKPDEKKDDKKDPPPERP